ncbi:MAG: type IV-A pilus assembly ATPase PilB [Methylococcaceae bacterium]
MATVSADFQFIGLSKCLIQAGLLTESDAKTYIKEAKQNKVSLISYLVSNKIIDSKSIAQQASVEFGIPFLDLDAIDWRSLPVKLVNEKLIRKYNALPLFTRGKTLFLAMSDPTNVQALDDIKFQSLLHPETILVEENKLANAIEIAMEAQDTSMKDLLDEDLDNLNISGGDDDATKIDVNSDIDDAPIVRFVNKILLDAIKKGASDIHMEPYEKNFRIRFRADGMLYQVASPPANIATRIISRVKVMSKMDIAERRVPQDGRIKMILSKHRAIDFRVNTCPTLFGEKVVLRILDPTTAQIGIEKLGFEPDQQKLFLEAINKPYGMVLVTGPTGSGKTVSLYTGLNILNSIDRNISTAEDPVEITVEGINQVNVNPKAGLTFANALRAFLRQDPDIIMVGEIRDLETADIAVKAAQTGHLVLSTLHTNDAPQTLNRLMQMGVAPFNIVSAVNLIMAQRLGRRLCEHCKTPANYPDNILLSAGFKEAELKDLTVFRPVGCEHCMNGYKGRVGIYQVMTLSEKMRTLILEGGNALQLTALAAMEGINDLRASGLNKIRQGITSLEEIDRVTKE